MIGAPDELQTCRWPRFTDHEPAISIAVCHWLAPPQPVVASGPIGAPASAGVRRPHLEALLSRRHHGSHGQRRHRRVPPQLSDEVIDVLADYFSAAPPSCTATWTDYQAP